MDYNKIYLIVFFDSSQDKTIIWQQNVFHHNQDCLNKDTHVCMIVRIIKSKDILLIIASISIDYDGIYFKYKKYFGKYCCED